MIKGDKSPHVITLERMMIPKHGSASTAKWIPMKQKTAGRCSKPENLPMNISERRWHPRNKRVSCIFIEVNYYSRPGHFVFYP
jgi:hypothetical protein